MLDKQSGGDLVMGEGLWREFILRFPPISCQSLPHGMSTLLHFWVVSLTLKKSEIMPFGVMFLSGCRSRGKIQKIPGTLLFMEYHCICGEL